MRVHKADRKRCAEDEYKRIRYSVSAKRQACLPGANDISRRLVASKVTGVPTQPFVGTIRQPPKRRLIASDENTRWQHC